MLIGITHSSLGLDGKLGDLSNVKGVKGTADGLRVFLFGTNSDFVGSKQKSEVGEELFKFALSDGVSSDCSASFSGFSSDVLLYISYFGCWC